MKNAVGEVGADYSYRILSTSEQYTKLKATVKDGVVETEVVRGGTIRSRAGVSIPSDRLSAPALTAETGGREVRAIRLEAPLRVDGRVLHQVWMPYHWGQGGLTTGDSANDLIGINLDPNVLIQESKVATCDVLPGRRPTGRDLVAFVEGYRRRAGVGGGRALPVVTATPSEED